MWSNYKYPQSIWAKRIAKHLKHDLNTIDSIVDAPAGNGLMGYLISKVFTTSSCTLIDINTDLLQSPYIQGQNIQAKIQDLNETPLPQSTVWLMINSLYCLNHAADIVNNNAKSFITIVFVLPKTNRINYRIFIKSNPGFSNPSVMSHQALSALMSENGFKEIVNEGLIKCPNHLFQPVLSFLKLPLAFQNKLYYCLDRLLFFLPNQYEIIIYKAHA